MALKKISGIVSNFREETEVTSTQSYRTGYSRVNTQKQINFRVDNRPVSMKMPKGIDLTDGDEATIVGTEGGGGMNAILVRNDGTGITYGMSFLYVVIWAIILLVGGIATVGIYIGYALLAMAAYLGFKAWQLKQAQGMLAAPNIDSSGET